MNYESIRTKSRPKQELIEVVKMSRPKRELIEAVKMKNSCNLKEMMAVTRAK